MKKIFLSNDEIYKLKKEGSFKLTVVFWNRQPKVGEEIEIFNMDNKKIAVAKVLEFDTEGSNCFNVTIKYIQKVCN